MAIGVGTIDQANTIPTVHPKEELLEQHVLLDSARTNHYGTDGLEHEQKVHCLQLSNRETQEQ